MADQNDFTMLKESFKACLFNKKTGYVLIAAALFVCIIGFLVMEFTMKPVFCGSCHSMKPYYQQWKASKHNKVACVKCHINPGFGSLVKTKVGAFYELVAEVLGKAPSRPHSQVDDKACLRKGCHTVGEIEDKELKTSKNITFNHGVHLDMEDPIGKLRCTSCHATMQPEKHVAVGKEVCAVCHLAQPEEEDPYTGELCRDCHTGPPAGELTIRGTKETYDHADYANPKIACQYCHTEMLDVKLDVPALTCQRCHNLKKKLDQIADHTLLHKKHVDEHKVECYVCHSGIHHGIGTKKHWASNAPNCQQCHTTSTEHTQAALLYQGKGGKGVEDSPSSMFMAGLDCHGCHTEKQAAAGSRDGIVKKAGAAHQQLICSPGPGRKQGRLGKKLRS
jgi:nitrate/TMAO reductase-like tetraheme cytochrome c subunit